MNCKHCGGSHCVKNGFQNGKQNYKCKTCHRSFTEGDRRHKDRTREKALCLLCYGMGNVSMRFLADLFNVSVRTIYLWLQDVDESFPTLGDEGSIQEMAMDEMGHCLSEKLKNYDSSKSWLVLQGERSTGSPVIVMLQQPSNDYTSN